MVAAGFLPVSIRNNKLFFLFGKECNSDSAPGYSDFGGGVEPNETNLYKAGLREFAEETTGFFGNATQLDKMIKKNGGCYKLNHDTYHIHIVKFDYDEKVCEYYNNNHKFIYDNLDHKYLKSTKIFEKIRIDWMTVEEMKSRRGEFRGFYREILDGILGDIPNIKNFINQTRNKRRTMKNYIEI
jgi:hypothetical protein